MTKPKLRVVLTAIMIFISAYVYCQNSDDYVVLRNDGNSQNIDTIFGKIDLPSKGVFWNVKIKTLTGERKFKTKEVVELKAGNLYFASIPYGTSYAIVPRIIDGVIDLYFYYTGSDRLTFIPQMQEEFRLDTKTSFNAPLLISNAIWDATSNFYIYDSVSHLYIKVPRSNDKFIEQVSHIFKGNDEIYKKIRTGEYKSEHIGRIVELYNQSSGSQ
jgi:hypothetical protein